MGVFRRRQRRDGDEPGNEAAEAVEPGELAAGELPAGERSGPWDEHDDVPDRERIDFGSLLVPVSEGIEIQVGVAEDQAAWVVLIRGESGLQLQAFAAPKSDGLWDDVRQEIAAEVRKAGGESHEADGPFGVELRARVAPGEPGPGTRQALEPVRFLGVDGPRWFLRGVINGPAARREELARPLEELFADVVVVRGNHPVPPRDLLDIRLPQQAQQALNDAVPEPGGGRPPLNPFERGPEITETR